MYIYSGKNIFLFINFFKMQLLDISVIFNLYLLFFEIHGDSYPQSKVSLSII